jgi:hypothetical protein
MTLSLSLDDDRDYLTVIADHDVRGETRVWDSEPIRRAIAGFTGHDMATAQEHVTCALFPQKVERYVKRIVDELRAFEDWRFRLRLALFNTELGAIPWELARLDGQNMLVSDKRCSMVREPAKDANRKSVVLADPCRVLFASARRVGLPFPTVEAASSARLYALRDSTGSLDIEDLPDVTQKELQLALKQPFDVFHFSGHGLADPENAGIVVDAKRHEDIGHEVVDEAQLVGMLRESGVSVVVLACCNSAAAVPGAGWSSLAGTLAHEEAIPAVIAMQQPIGNDAAARFAEVFYEVLISTRSVDEAVAAGRQTLATDDYSRAIPVLYSRADAAEVVARPPLLTDVLCGPAVVAPRHTCQDNRGAASVSLSGSSWCLAPRGTTVAFDAYGAEDDVSPWSLGATVQDVAVSQDGTVLVALAEGRLRVTSFDAYGRMHNWTTTFGVPTGHEHVLAARCGDDVELEVLVGGQDSQAIVACAAERAVPSPRVVAHVPRAAAPTPQGFIRIDGDGRLVGAGDDHVARLSATQPAGWLSIDRAESAGHALTVAAHQDGIVYVVSGHDAEIRWLSLPAVSRVHAVRTLGGEPPSSIAAAAGGTLSQWTVDQLDVVAPAGSPA